jgi:hypothetical protein
LTQSGQGRTGDAPKNGNARPRHSPLSPDAYNSVYQIHNESQTGEQLQVDGFLSSVLPLFRRGHL